MAVNKVIFGEQTLIDITGDTVTADKLLAGITAHDASGQQITGTMINRGQVTGSMSYANDVFAISQGYHDGSGTVTIDSVEQAKIIPENIKSGVRILGVDGALSSGVDTSSDTVTADKLLSGTTAHNASGEAITGTMTNRGSVSGEISTINGSYTIPAGYHNGSGSVQISASEQAKIIAGNIKSGVNILGVQGTLSGMTFVELAKNVNNASNFAFSKSLYEDNTDLILSLNYSDSNADTFLDEYYVTRRCLYVFQFFTDSSYSSDYLAAFSLHSIKNRSSSMANCLALVHPYRGLYNIYYFVAPDNGYVILQKNSEGVATQETKAYRVDFIDPFDEE